jgi:hypothetical protein
MIAFKIFLVLFILGWIIGLALITGETYAMENKHPRFTRWWRKHWIGTEDKLYSRKQNKK